jgi:hypothetical protein
MKWEAVEQFLTNVAKALNCRRGDLLFLRETSNGWINITKENADWGYLKPDMGFGAHLNRYKVMHAGWNRDITSWGLYEFPSCCAFCVSTGAFVEPISRRKGINTLSNRFRQDLAKEAGYSALICTDILTNVGERRTLEVNEFKDIYQIRNARTGNEVVISVKELK